RAGMTVHESARNALRRVLRSLVMGCTPSSFLGVFLGVLPRRYCPEPRGTQFPVARRAGGRRSSNNCVTWWPWVPQIEVGDERGSLEGLSRRCARAHERVNHSSRRRRFRNGPVTGARVRTQFVVATSRRAGKCDAETEIDGVGVHRMSRPFIA